jgi:uncharacterized protein YkwD
MMKAVDTLVFSCPNFYRIFRRVLPAGSAVRAAVLIASIALACSAFAQDDLDKTVTARFLPAMNQMRTSAGLAPLTDDDTRISDAARLHLAEFMRTQQISDQYEGEPGLAERLGLAQVPQAAAGEMMFIIPEAEIPASDLLQTESVKRVLLNPKFQQIGFAAAKVGPQTYVVSNLVQPLRMLSIGEVEGLLVQSLQSLRAGQKQPQFKTPDMSRLRGVACDMAKKDSIKAPPMNPYAGYTGAPSTNVRNFTYTTVDPGRLPRGIEGIAGDPKLNAVSVGSCFAKSPTHPAGTYWVALLFYSK